VATVSPEICFFRALALAPVLAQSSAIGPGLAAATAVARSSSDRGSLDELFSCVLGEMGVEE
jgi:hypothetical protein